MKIIIYDDNQKDRDTLKGLLRDYETNADCKFEIEEYNLREGHCNDFDKLRNGKPQTVEYTFVEGKTRLYVDDIIYIETSRHKNLFHTRKQTYSIYKKLDEIEAELSDMGFLRVHLSYLVNMRYIEKISSYVLRLVGGQELSVPKARYKEVKKRYTLYKGGE